MCPVIAGVNGKIMIQSIFIFTQYENITICIIATKTLVHVCNINK